MRVAVGEAVLLALLVGLGLGDFVRGVAVGGIVTVGIVGTGSVGGGVSVGGSKVTDGSGVLLCVRVRVTDGVGVCVWVDVGVAVGLVGVAVQGTGADFPCSVNAGSMQGAACDALALATPPRKRTNPQFRARFATRMRFP